MTVLFILVPLALLLAGVALLGFAWSARSGQLDDLVTPALRVLHDDETAPRARASQGPPASPEREGHESDPRA